MRTGGGPDLALQVDCHGSFNVDTAAVIEEKLRELGVTVAFARVQQRLLDRFTAELRYNQIISGKAKPPVLAVHLSESQQVS